MKKWILIAAGAVLLGGAGLFFLYQWTSAKAPAGQTVTAKVERSMIRSVVASTGRVVSNQDVDIKCKASGEVAKLPFDVSDSVGKGDLLVELDPIDEQRVLRQTDVALLASQARLAIAKQNLLIAERTLATDETKAKANLQSAQARANDARSKADRTKQLFEKKLSSREEYDTAETAAIQAASDLQNVQVRMEELKTQEIALELKRQDVKLAEAQVESDTIARSVAQDRLEDTRVVAPMDGVVAARNVQIGQIISSGISNVGGGTTVLTLSDLSRIFVYASVDESDIGRVRVGQPVNITADAFPGRGFRGAVVRIATKGTNISNVVTFEVRIEVTPDGASSPAPGSRGPHSGAQSEPAGTAGAAGPEGGNGPTQPANPASGPSSPAPSAPGRSRFLLKPEMTANVEIVVAEKNNAMTVPTEAVLRKGGKHYATVVGERGTTEDREVRVGISDGMNWEIVSGLSEGQTVLVRKGSAESKWNSQRTQGGPPRSLMMPGGGRGR